MAITLDIGTEILSLPENVAMRPQPFQLQKIQMEIDTARGAGRYIRYKKELKDIPFDLRGGWYSFELLNKLYNSAIGTDNESYVLTYSENTYNVFWRVNEWPCIEAMPIQDYAVPANEDLYENVVLKFVWSIPDA